MWTLSNVNIWNFEYGVKLVDTYYGVFDRFCSIRQCRIAILTDIGETNEINTIDFRNVKINSCTIEEAKELVPRNEEEDDESWSMRYARCGVDAYTCFLNSKFDGMTIEGCDYGFRFNYVPHEVSGTQDSLINITQCYFEAITKYSIYFGIGNISDINIYDNFINHAKYIVNIIRCVFNSNNIFLSEGYFNINDNLSKGSVIIDKGDSAYPCNININNSYSLGEGEWDSHLVSIIDCYKYFNQPDTDNNPYQTNLLQKLQENLGYNAKVCVPITDYGPMLRDIFSISSISGIGLRFENYIFKNLISYKDYYSNNALYPSGLNVANLKLDQSSTLSYSKNKKGIPFYILLKYLKEGKEYKGYVQEVFYQEIYIDHDNKCIKNVKDDSVVGYGKDWLLKNEYVLTDGKKLVNIDTGKLNISYGNKLINYSDIINGYVTNLDSVGLYAGTKELQDVLPSYGYINDIVLLSTDNKYYIFNGYSWVEFTDIKQRYFYKSFGSSIEDRMKTAQYRGQTFLNIKTGAVYTWFSDNKWSNSISYQNYKTFIESNISEYLDGDIVVVDGGNYFIKNKGKWIDRNGFSDEVKSSGLFSDKPISSLGIKSGFQYFCTDKQSPESSEPGLMIYYKGDDVWVDSLGRVVDENYPATPPATSGTTEERPLGVDSGFQYFDTTLKKPIWKTEDGWVDCTGASV